MMVPPLLFAGAAVALGRGLFAGYPEKVLDPSHMSAKEQAIVAACADAFFPKDGPIPISGTEAGLVAYMDRYMDRLPEGQRVLVHLLYWFIEHGPWVFGIKKRFTSLDEAGRLAVLERMRTSPIYFRRIAFLSMRTMLTMGYLAHPTVAKSMRMKADTDPFNLGNKQVEVQP
ncbi:MAG: gluconate 2-dehydrogenase subunit 3 family protein [Polyangiaceae bacterium]